MLDRALVGVVVHNAVERLRNLHGGVHVLQQGSGRVNGVGHLHDRRAVESGKQRGNAHHAAQYAALEAFVNARN